MTDDSDRLRELLTWTGEPLPPSPGQFERVHRRARIRRLYRAVVPTAAAVLAAGAAAVIVVTLGSSGAKHNSMPLGRVEPTLSLAPTPTENQPTPTPTPTERPTPLDTAGAASFKWSIAQAPQVGHGFSGGLSCPTADFCVAAVSLTSTGPPSGGEDGLVQFDRGVWSAPTVEGTFAGGFVSTSCANRSFCMAAATNGVWTSWDGTRWGPPGLLKAAEHVYPPTLACTSESFCLISYGDSTGATGQRSTAYATWNGQRWSSFRVLSQIGLTSVSCTTTTFCMAVGSGSSGDVALMWDGASWSLPMPLKSSSLGLGSISCPTTRFCMAVGGYHASGDVYATWDGSTWSPESQRRTGLGSDGFASVSCPTNALCVAVDFGSGVNSEPSTFKPPLISVWRADSWAGATQESVQAPIVSCATESRCLAVGAFGRSTAYETNY
jgi:hypothetical protein